MSDPTAFASDRLAGIFASELIDLAPDGLGVVDEDGTILLVNRRFNVLFGYDEYGLVGEPVEVLVPELQRAAHYGHRATFRAQPQVRQMNVAGRTLNARRKDGSQFPVEVSLSPMQIGYRTVTVAAVRDVTERLRVDADAAMVRQMLDAATDAMFIFDRDTLQFSYVNEGAVRQLGFSRDELLSMTQLAIKPALDEPSYRQLIDQLVPGGSTMFTTLHRHRDGHLMDVEVTLEQPVVDASVGGSYWLISIARDVTDRVNSERRMRDVERQLAVLDDRERIARDLHDRVIQRIFAAGLAASSVHRQVTDPHVADRIGHVVDELDAVIADVRSSIFRLAETEPLVPLAQRVLELCALECGGSGVTTNVRFGGPVDAVEPTRAEDLLAVLTEALGNVVRHARASTVEVALLVDDGITLRVEDDGVGLSPGNGSGPTHVVRSGGGLDSMAARARHLGGSLQVASGAPSGTLLEWRVPGRVLRSSSPEHGPAADPADGQAPMTA